MKNVGELKERIERAFSSLVDSVDVARDIAFHMTDWDDDMERLLQLYKDPQAPTDDEITAIILQFLAHAPDHLAAAKKLSGMGPIEDIFGVGVLEEDKD